MEFIGKSLRLRIRGRYKKAPGLSAFLLISFMLLHPAQADESIKVLMLDSPSNPLPSRQAEKIEDLKGKVFFNGQSYSGSIEVMRDENGLYVVNSLPFEKYIEGVVASEVGRNWNMEALKAQAVISRTYAVFNKNLNGEKNYHLTSSVLHQVYKGENPDPLVTEAVTATEGEILTYQGKPVNALYHSTCEGKTELPEEVWAESFPYLKSVECNGKNTPYESWRKRFAFEEINKALGMTGFKDIAVISITATGRAKTLRIVYSSMNETNPSGMEIRATELRRLLGYKEMPSTDFTVTRTDTEVIFDGKGYGHGVGLSQWGALEMAREGKNYMEILSHYYPGTVITKDKGQMHSRNQGLEK
ncbi:MAG: SpoIID/LytB domain-containing protein [Nitrospiraceae bacterium]|nr:MAG: SpoIID/LytB domain-containing protein [Nitrospiraceae bacterium]